MPIDITMPSIGPNIAAGLLSRWLVTEGQQVKSGEPIAEIESEKATMEVEAERDGVIARILVAAGNAPVSVGDVIAVLSQPGEVVQPRIAERAPTRVDSRRIKASPIARRLARERKVDLTTLRGTGPGGRIVKVDVEAARGSAPRDIQPVTQAPTPPTSTLEVSHEPPHSVEQLSTMRKTIARRLGESKRTVPHFYVTVDVSVDELLRLRAEVNASQSRKVSVNDLLIKALGCALQRTPAANVRYGDDALLRYTRADVSVAVATPAGLFTPVVRDVASKSVVIIAAEMHDLAERARAGKLAVHEYQGGSASLSNLGMYGVRQFDAVINPPQASILAIGAAEKRAVVIEDQLRIATQMSVTGSFDHRAIDGAVGAQLLTSFKQLIERPLQLLL